MGEDSQVQVLSPVFVTLLTAASEAYEIILNSSELKQKNSTFKSAPWLISDFLIS